MLAKDIVDLLSIDYLGLFDDQHQCFTLLEAKRVSGDADTPAALTEKPVFELSPDLFIWVTQKHIDNGSGHLVAQDVMSNVALAGLSGTYGQIVDMLADAGYQERAAQIWRADVASHMDVYRAFLRAHTAVAKYDSAPETQQAKSAPDRHLRKMATQYAQRKQAAHDAICSFESWSTRYKIEQRHAEQMSLWKAELQNDTRPKLPAPDKTPMSDALFWTIISDARSASESETILNIEARMVTYSAMAIRTAAKTVQTLAHDAYRNDIWALAYVLHDGCSDDGFDDFRNWMILQGQATFEGILANPDGFDPQRIKGADTGAAGGLMSAFENAYSARAGKPLILPRRKPPKIKLDEDRFATLVPQVAARL